MVIWCVREERRGGLQLNYNYTIYIHNIQFKTHPRNQGPVGVVEKPNGSNPTSPNMLPSSVAGAVAKGRAWEGAAFAQAALEKEPEERGAVAFFLALADRVVVGVVGMGVRKHWDVDRRVVRRTSFII